MDKTIKDIDRIVTLQLQRLKKEYARKYGNNIPKFWQKEGHRLDGLISALAWVKVFAIEDKSYNPKKIDDEPNY
jgi:hypothetical protein